ncbi:MAG: glycerophosphodiester phosphodiesterase family protein [Jatrophihabitans sp.]
MSDFLAAPGPIAFAHRGYAPDGGENTMAAFERAVRLGYRYLETDVRVTADGVALAFHDATLNRMTDRRGRLSTLPWSAVRRARIGVDEPIPLLTELLDAWPDLRINLDIKSAVGVGPTVDAIRCTGSLTRVCVGSFSARRITAVRRALGPGLCTSLGPRAALSVRATRGRDGYVGRCAQVPVRIGLGTLVDARYLAAARRLGLKVHIWTINGRDEMIRLLDLGVDGIMTDRAEVLRDVLIERGQWPSVPRET